MGERDTKQRILDAAEALLVEHGAASVSLRQITTAADVNLAAVHYHFGGKQNLLEAVLAQHLDPLHDERIRLLEACERNWAGGLTCEHVLAALFAPALRRAHLHPGFLRFLGRVYTDGAPAVARFIHDRYEPVTSRFAAAFAAVLPELPQAELTLRLQFVLKAIAGVIASVELPDLLRDIGVGRGQVSDGELLARLTTLMVGALAAPPHAAHDRDYGEIIRMLDAPASRACLQGAHP